MERKFKGADHTFIVRQESGHYEVDSELRGSHQVTVLSVADFDSEQEARDRFADTCRAYEFLGFEPMDQEGAA